MNRTLNEFDCGVLADACRRRQMVLEVQDGRGRWFVVGEGSFRSHRGRRRLDGGEYHGPVYASSTSTEVVVPYREPKERTS